MSKPPETDEEWTEYLRETIAKVTGDTESEHLTADYVLVEFLNSKGYVKLADAWEEVPKWYA